jgi:hypothetical protein
VAERLAASLHPGGALALGAHETLPAAISGVAPWPSAPHVYRRG